MLYLTRKVGETVIINDNIEVTVIEVRGKTVKLGFTFPPEASVLRREIYERIQEEQRRARAAGVEPPPPPGAGGRRAQQQQQQRPPEGGKPPSEEPDKG